MSKFKSEKVMPRFFAIAIILTLSGVAVVGKAFYTMTAKKDYWEQVAAREKRVNDTIASNRGNILSCDGQLMASSIPQYKIYMDFKAGGFKKDSLLGVKMDSICEGLAAIFPKTAEEFRHDIEKARKDSLRHWAIWPHRISYNEFCEVKKLPVFKLGQYKGGFHYDPFNARRRPFGSLAQRTVGDMFGAIDSARCGLELSFDSLLRGENGIVHVQKVLDRRMQIVDKAPVDGYDIVTTIDVSMQDLAERAVIDELKLIGGDLGVAILMEVKTGDVKAIVNMTRCADGEYREIKNNAVSDLREPGSVFKTASILVALDAGVCDTTKWVDTGGGVWNMHGRDMKDHNWRKGGYGTISLPRTLEVSSNIGVSRIIDEYFGSHPEKFVKGIYKTGLATDLKLPIVGYAKPRIRMPDYKTTNRALYWSKTTLPWMSIGYETQIPPISTLTFYNAIANDGKMMRPRFVKALQKNGEVVKEFPPEVIIEHIAKDKTIKTMQTILEHVVSQGLGRKAAPLSRAFKVAGKTGTAQIAEDGQSYHSGTMKYWLSFAGFFPADNPRYSCIVCLKKAGLPASGGGMSGVVFRQIAEGVMAQNVKRSVEEARDTASILIPEVKNGNIVAADYVLNNLSVPTSSGWNGNIAQGKVWGTTNREAGRVTATELPDNLNTVPNLVGMGARDAIYMLEKRGVRAIVKGRGRVSHQTLSPGTGIRKGMSCTLTLEL